MDAQVKPEFTAALVGALLRENRKAANLTQTELAEKLGVSLRSVQLWEKGQTPRPAHRRKLAAFFNEDGRSAA